MTGLPPNQQPSNLRPLTLHEAATGIFGAWRLLRFDAGGMGAFDTTPAGAARSFWLMPWLFVPWLVIVALQVADAIVGVPFSRFIAAEAVGYVVAWVAFPLVMAAVTDLTGRRERWTGWLVAYNWSAVIQVAIWLPTLALAESGMLPDGVGMFAVFAVSLGLMAYHGFIARTALGYGRFAALGVVVLDLMVSAAVNDATIGVMRGN
jgi:hypothetical protein